MHAQPTFCFACWMRMLHPSAMPWCARWRHKPTARPYNFFPNYSLGTVCYCHRGSLKRRGKALHIWNSKKHVHLYFPWSKATCWCHDACCFPTVHLASWQLEGNAEKIAVMDFFMEFQGKGFCWVTFNIKWHRSCKHTKRLHLLNFAPVVEFCSSLPASLSQGSNVPWQNKENKKISCFLP